MDKFKEKGMSKLTEKLGITPGPYIHNIYDHGGSRLYREEGENRNLICDTYGQKENALCFRQAPEMLEALIDTTIKLEEENLAHNWDKICPAMTKMWRNITVIEKATDKSWPEIKQLIGEGDGR